MKPKIAMVKNLQRLMEAYDAVENRDPDDWKNRYMLGWGDASAGIDRLNQEWQFDSTPADLLLAGGRHSLIGVIDVYSRRAALYVAKTSKAAAIAALTRRVLPDWGVPERVKTDNGQDYVSHHLTRIFQALGIEQQTSAPFSPWQKPHIERCFRAFARDLVEMLPGFIGHNVGARQQFIDRLFVRGGTVELIGMTPEDFQAFCDRWCAAYHARPQPGFSPWRADKKTRPARQRRTGPFPTKRNHDET